MKKSILKYIVCLLAVLISVVVVDQLIGIVLDRLFYAIPTSQDVGKGRYAMYEVNADIVIVGSSRASHHYVSRIIQDSMKCSVYNVGRDGCFFSDNLCVTNAILDRYSPKIIILEVANECLNLSSKTTVEGMFPYYWHSPYIQDVVNSEIGWKAPVQLFSKLYRYNPSSFRVIGYGIQGMISGKYSDSLLGYAPLPYREKQIQLVLGEAPKNKEEIIVQTRVKQLNCLLQKAKQQNVQMLLLCSPLFKKAPIEDSKSKDIIIALCRQNSAYYYDFSSDEYYFKHPEWFDDASHMNLKGADEYTKRLIKIIKHLNNSSTPNGKKVLF